MFWDCRTKHVFKTDLLVLGNEKHALASYLLFYYFRDYLLKSLEKGLQQARRQRLVSEASLKFFSFFFGPIVFHHKLQETNQRVARGKRSTSR